MISKELIQKFLRSNCSAEEEQSVIEWYNSFDAKDDPYEHLTADKRAELRERMLGNILRAAGPVKKRYAVLKYWYYSAGAAAIIVFMLNIGVFTKKIKVHSQQEVAELTFFNSTRMLYKKVLPDKSIVWVSPGSKIEYPQVFKGNFREVNLYGESFFEVTKDHAHPFIIHSPNMITKVWGTSFRVTDHPGSGIAEVVVVTGKVSVSSINKKNGSKQEATKEEGVMLTPKQGVVYSSQMKQLKLENVSPSSAINIWNKAQLEFNNVPLKDAVDTLNKQLGIQLILNDQELAQSKIQADFRGKNVPEILNVLSKLLNLTYVTDGRRFVLQKGTAN